MIRRNTPYLAAFLAAILLGGCAGLQKLNPLTWWGSGGSGPQPLPLTDIKSTVTLAPAWRAGIGSAGSHYFTPALAGDYVYAAAADGALAAFDARSGVQKWRVQANRGGLSAGVAVGEGTVVVATVKGEVLAFDASGVEKWKALVSSEVLAAPLVVEGLVLVRSNDNRIYAFAVADGKRRWVYQRTAPALVLRNFAGLAVGRGIVYAGFPGGRLVALATANGTVRWEGTVASPKGSTELERIADITGDPVVGERMACAAAYQGRVSCFDALNGQPVWSRDVSSQTGLTADARYVFVTDDRSALVGLALETGSSLWKQERLLHRGMSAPLSIGRAVIVGDYQGILHALAREDGSLIGRAATDGAWIAAPPLRLPLGVAEGFLVQTRAGGLFAFSL